MIGYLNGILKWKDENQIIIDINGVGYLLEVSDRFKSFKVGEEIELFVYTYVREDSLTLFGFELMEERQLFQTLLSVSGIGPKAGLNILSSVPGDRFVNAILTENVAVLKQIHGIGPKTAQRLILELKNKVNNLAGDLAPASTAGYHDDELHDALSALGYSTREIEEAVRNVDFNKSDLLEVKLKEVLNYLGKGS